MPVADLLFVVGRLHGVDCYNQQAFHVHRNLAVIALFESASRSLNIWRVKCTRMLSLLLAAQNPDTFIGIRMGGNEFRNRR